ncbi:MAG TPA: hypothetical protein VLA56_19385 [Pseudomonadales bacterium]|nr:hypothetical protein [Pseudomonadales bacterium]
MRSEVEVPDPLQRPAGLTGRGLPVTFSFRGAACSEGRLSGETPVLKDDTVRR